LQPGEPFTGKGVGEEALAIALSNN